MAFHVHNVHCVSNSRPDPLDHSNGPETSSRTCLLVCTPHYYVSQKLLRAIEVLALMILTSCFPSLFMNSTFLAHRNLREKYEAPFRDAALLQTALLDGWDVSEESSPEKREKLRKWLVDAHKASYVPVCLVS